MSDERPITLAFWLVTQIAEAMGVERINELEGCWEVPLDRDFWFAVNAHRSDVLCSKGTPVPPFHAYIEWKGWPAGLVSPAGGAMMIVSEDDFINACQRWLEARERAA